MSTTTASSSAAPVLQLDELSNEAVSLGSRIVLDDLDEGTREEYVLVSSAESNPAEGQLSNESPVGRAIEGRHTGDVVEARAPNRIRRLRIAGTCANRRA